MFRLALILHLFIGSTLAGVAVIAFLVMGGTSGWMLLAVAVAGFLIAFPASWYVAKELYAR
ncbi:MAG: CTP synthetase [Shimia sp.]|jgi:hypothetical protein|uniref:CTP synthetase n=1 Tax=Shimia sp. TaxID=1954381 RepID=UPI00405A44BD